MTSEINPPKGTHLEKTLAEAKQIAQVADAINVTDGQRALMKVGSLMMSALLVQEGIEPVYQMTVRDRNRLALQSDLLSAACAGIHNLLVLSGDPIQIGDHPDTKPVFDLDALGLIRAAQTLNTGKDIGGNDLDGGTDFYIAAAANPGASDLNTELSKFDAKMDAGAHFFQTQAVYDISGFEKFLNVVRKKHPKVPILAGVIPLKSAKMARFMNEKIPGVHVPDALIQEIDAAEDKEAMAVDIAARIVRGLKPLAQGVHLMPIGWGHMLGRIAEEAGLVASRT